MTVHLQIVGPELVKRFSGKTNRQILAVLVSGLATELPAEPNPFMRTSLVAKDE